MAGVELGSQQGWREESWRPRREEVMCRQAGAAGFYRELPSGAEDAGDTQEFIQVMLFGAGRAAMAQEFPSCAGSHLLPAPAAVAQHQIGPQR